MILKIIFLNLVIISCTGGKDQTNREPIQAMMDQISLKAQDYDKDLGMSARKLPKNSIPRGGKSYSYKDPLQAERKLKNPYKEDFSALFLKRGRKQYEIFCMVCHGPQGEARSLVASKMLLKPPSLLSKKVREFKDGRVFHIITKGQGLMGGYGSQIFDEKDRWAIINYLRSLQKKGALR